MTGLGWYPCSRLKHNWSVHVECGGWGLMTVLNRGFISPGFCSGMNLPSRWKDWSKVCVNFDGFLLLLQSQLVACNLVLVDRLYFPFIGTWLPTFRNGHPVYQSVTSYGVFV